MQIIKKEEKKKETKDRRKTKWKKRIHAKEIQKNLKKGGQTK